MSSPASVVLYPTTCAKNLRRRRSAQTRLPCSGGSSRRCLHSRRAAGRKLEQRQNACGCDRGSVGSLGSDGTRPAARCDGQLCRVDHIERRGDVRAAADRPDIAAKERPSRTERTHRRRNRSRHWICRRRSDLAMSTRVHRLRKVSGCWRWFGRCGRRPLGRAAPYRRMEGRLQAIEGKPWRDASNTWSPYFFDAVLAASVLFRLLFLECRRTLV